MEQAYPIAECRLPTADFSDCRLAIEIWGVPIQRLIENADWMVD
jgi:hypothetical protein